MALLHHEVRDFTTIASFRAIEVQPQENDKFFCAETGIFYDYDASSSATDDNYYIITPTSYAGRFVAVTSSSNDFWRSGAGGIILPNSTNDYTENIRRDGNIGLNVDPSTTVDIDSTVASDSGLRTRRMINTTASASDAGSIGVDANGKVVRMTLVQTISITNGALQTTPVTVGAVTNSPNLFSYTHTNTSPNTQYAEVVGVMNKTVTFNAGATSWNNRMLIYGGTDPSGSVLTQLGNHINGFTFGAGVTQLMNMHFVRGCEIVAGGSATFRMADNLNYIPGGGVATIQSRNLYTYIRIWQMT